MIVCVCLNPALDMTYQVAELVPGASHRAQLSSCRAGGKGVNVARVLHQLHEPVLVMGLLGGATGTAVASELAAAGVPTLFTATCQDARRTVTVVDRRDATVLNEPGPVLDERDWSAFLREFDTQVGAARVVVLSGSLPPGLPAEAYRVLTERARASGAVVVVDAAGPALTAALEAGPDLVKPNVVELAGIVGRDLSELHDVLQAAESLRRNGARVAVVSRGAHGLVALTGAAAFRAAVKVRVSGNATGAGDALTAVLARGMRRGDDWRSTLREGVAVSAAAVTVQHAGEADLAHAGRLLGDVEVEEMPWP